MVHVGYTKEETMRVKHIFSIIFISFILAVNWPIDKVSGQCLYDFEKTKQGWVFETHHSTRGAVSAKRSKLKSFSAKYSLIVRLELSKNPKHLSQGEIRVDLRSHPPRNKFGPLDLDKKVVGT